MKLRFRSVSLLALALSLPAIASAQAPTTAEGGALDTPVAADSPQPTPAPAPTGDPVLDRLNALDARVHTLEQENAALRAQASDTETRVQKVEVRAAKASATNGIVPTFSDVNGITTFKVRGVLDADYVGFNERKGGYDYNNGTGFRRARLGFEGTAFKNFNWRVEVDFAGNVVALQDAYVQYAGLKPLEVTLGQFKAPFGLESNNSDNYNVFLERGMFNNAASTLGAERRIGVALGYVKRNFTLTAGLFGENESFGRIAPAATASSSCAKSNTVRPSLCDTPDEGYGGNVRVTWEPVLEDRRILHLGAASYYRTNLRTASAVGIQASDRPNVRVDNGNIADSGLIPDAKSAWYYGFEAAGVYGPFTLAAEYGRLKIKRDKDQFPAQTGLIPGAGNPSFDGWYVYGTWFLTGESRPFKNGNYDRIRPFHDVDGKGGWGAWEVALRYDQANFSDTPVVLRRGNKAHSLTAALNWYWNPFMKLEFNYIRFAGTNTPLDPVGDKTKGEAFATRLHIDW